MVAAIFKTIAKVPSCHISGNGLHRGRQSTKQPFLSEPVKIQTLLSVTPRELVIRRSHPPILLFNSK
jgi:hypothetical protein